MRWKYKMVALSDDAKASGKHLTGLGAHGWELVAVTGNEKRFFAFLRMEAEDSVVVKL